MIQPPDRRRLTRAWLVLLALTVGSLAAAGVGLPELPASFGLAGTGAVLLVMVFKARRVLMDFLNLKAAPAGWRHLFTLWLAVLAATIWLAATAPAILAA